MQTIKWLFLDVDGILTDGRLWYDESGEVLKCFDVYDGQGLKELMRTGVRVGVISGRDCAALRKRLADLSITCVFLGVTDKLAVYNQIKVEEKIHDDEVAYMGDDTPDLLVMQQVGLPITVPNAIDAIKAIAVITTQHEGGRGAVREICDYLMTCQPTT